MNFHHLLLLLLVAPLALGCPAIQGPELEIVSLEPVDLPSGQSPEHLHAVTLRLTNDSPVPLGYQAWEADNPDFLVQKRVRLGWEPFFRPPCGFGLTHHTLARGTSQVLKIHFPRDASGEPGTYRIAVYWSNDENLQTEGWNSCWSPRITIDQQHLD